MNGVPTALPWTDRPAFAAAGRYLSTLARRASARPPWMITSALFLVLVGIGWGDYVTGWELSVSVIYALPILIGIWVSGRNSGLLLALLCAPVWWVANQNQTAYQTEWGYNLALLNREIFWLFVAFGGSAIRSKQQAYETQIRMLKEMRQLEKEIVSIAEHEQQRIGQDLHDGICQQLAAIGCATRALAEDLHARGIPEAADAEKIGEAMQQTMGDARSLARGIFPIHVDRSGLPAALAELAGRTSLLTGIDITFAEGAQLPSVESEAAMHLYRIAQEAVSNAVRHSGARHVTLSLNATGGSGGSGGLELRIEDDGKGLGLKAHGEGSGMGLRTMKYRAQSIGATLSIQPRVNGGGGAAVVCRLRGQRSS